MRNVTNSRKWPSQRHGNIISENLGADMAKKQILRCDVIFRLDTDGEISIHGVPKDIFEQLAKQADDNVIYDGVEWVEFGKVTFYKD